MTAVLTAVAALAALGSSGRLAWEHRTALYLLLAAATTAAAARTRLPVLAPHAGHHVRRRAPSEVNR